MQNELTKGQKIKYLEGYRWTMESIRLLTERMEKLNHRLYGLKGKEITDMPRGGEGINSLDLLADKIDMESELLERLQSAFEVRNTIISLIRNLLDPKHRIILEMRYLDFVGLSEIAEKFGYSYKHICRLHGEALEQLEIKKE